MGNGRQPTSDIRSAPASVGDYSSPFESTSEPEPESQATGGDSDASSQSESGEPLFPRLSPREPEPVKPNVEVKLDAEKAKTLLEGIAVLGGVI